MPEIKISVETKDGNKINLSVGTDGLVREHLTAVLDVVKQLSVCNVPVVSNHETETEGRLVQFANNHLEEACERAAAHVNPGVPRKAGFIENKNRKFTLNYRLAKLEESDRGKLSIDRNAVVGMVRSLIATDFDYYCKYTRTRLEDVESFMSTSREWAQVFKRFNIIDRGVSEEESLRLSRIVLRLLVSRQYTLETECPGKGAGPRKVVAQLCRRRNSEGKAVYVFAIRDMGAAAPTQPEPNLVGISSLHGGQLRGSGT